MREHIEVLMTGLATALRRDGRRGVRRRGPRKARGTFVPVAPELPAMRLAH
jgi:hypothetical protein